jgi:D-alanyl-D-alanine carboxypeptidase
MRRRMTGASWHPGCPLGLDRLRLLTLSFRGFDHAVHRGQLIVNESAAKALTRAFGLLFAARYPIRQMRVTDVFGGSDERSMLADNTSAFNCRRVRGTTSWSEHAYGLAVDINPFENPEVLDTVRLIGHARSRPTRLTGWQRLTTMCGSSYLWFPI